MPEAAVGTKVEVVPATVERWDDVMSVLDAAGFRRVLTTDATSARIPRLLVRLDLA